MVLEVKRVKLRFDSAGIWNEFEKVNRGGLQLHKTMTALQEGLVDLAIPLPQEKSNITGLIITPWFEHDHQSVNGFLKVSWFEIRYAMEQMKSAWFDKENRLKALTDLIKNDRVWPQRPLYSEIRNVFCDQSPFPSLFICRQGRLQEGGYVFLISLQS